MFHGDNTELIDIVVR